MITIRNPITSDELTPMEKRIYKAIVFEGMDFKELGKRFSIERATVVAHINAICQKKQVWGNSRLFELTSQFWGEFMKNINWNCSLCQYNTGKCINPNSQFFNEKFSTKKKAENMVCSRFKGKQND